MKTAGRSRSHAALLGVLALLAVAAIAGGVFFLRPRATAVQAVTARRGDLLVRVLCDGNLEPPPGGELRSADGGIVAEIAVREGERVRQGEILLRLDNREIEAGLRQAQADLSRLGAERAAAAADLDRAGREAAYRRRLADGDRRLVAAQALPAASAEADELAARQAEAQASAARAQLAALAAGSSRAPSRLALGAATAGDLARRAAALTVRAPFAGVAYGLPRAAGQVVQPGEAVADVADPDHPRVRFRIDPPDVPKIAVGERLTVSSSGLAERSWEGRVTAAGGGLREVGGRQVGEALGKIADTGNGFAALPLNAAVDVQVVVGERRGVLTIPRGALRREGGRRFVWLVAGDRVRRREVAVGLVGLAEVEVASGLAAGDRVVADPAVSLREGDRVRTAAP